MNSNPMNQDMAAMGIGDGPAWMMGKNQDDDHLIKKLNLSCSARQSVGPANVKHSENNSSPYATKKDAYTHTGIENKKQLGSVKICRVPPHHSN